VLDDITLIWCLRAAGAFHFVTLVAACVTPIPPNWDENLAKLPLVHRRFAVAQNAFIGATIAVCGLWSLFFARELVSGTPLARAVCAAIALWWGGRFAVLPWLRVWPQLRDRPTLRAGFVLLLAECAIYTLAYGWMAARP
jgi:hypothetical protein